MKRILFILMGFALVSCEKSELLTYQEDSGIYFNNNQMMRDTVSVPWGLKNSEIVEQRLQLEVKLIGQVKNYDRNFKIRVVEDPNPALNARVNQDYKPFPLEYTIPKGAASAFINIDLLRSADLAESHRNLTIELEENEELKFLYTRKLPDTLGNVHLLDIRRVIKMNENFPRPSWWPFYGQKYFGDWSVKKAILICDMMDIDRETWVGNVHATPEFTEGLLRFAGVYIHRWLQEQNPAILEDNGEPMVMGPQSQR